MKKIKRFVYGMLYRFHSRKMIQYKDWFEQGALIGDRREMKYCDKHYRKHYEKCEKYYAKKKEI